MGVKIEFRQECGIYPDPSVTIKFSDPDTDGNLIRDVICLLIQEYTQLVSDKNCFKIEVTRNGS